jgi:hypothetical protein
MFMFSGAFFVRILEGHLSNLCAMPWIPLLLWAVDGWNRERTARWIGWGGLAVAMQVLAGHPQYVYYTALFTGLYVLFADTGKESKVGSLTGSAGMWLLGGLLSAVQLFAGWDAARESARSQALSIGVLDMLNLTPERLCTLFMPYFYGGWKDYWGGGLYFEGNLFVTVTGFVLALLAWRASADRDRKLFFGLSAFLILLMVGRRTPLFLFFCKYVPLFASFRGISKLNILLVLCLAALAAGTFDAVLKSKETLAKHSRFLTWSGVFLALLSGVFFLASRWQGGRLFREFAGHSGSMVLNLLGTGIFLGFLAGLGPLIARYPRLKWVLWALVLGESLVFTGSNFSSFDLEGLRGRTSAIQRTYDREPGDYRIWTAMADHSLSAPSGLDVWGEDPMMPARYARFAVMTQGYDFSGQLLTRHFFNRFPSVLGLTRFRYIFEEKPEGWSRRPTGLKEIPRAMLVGNWETAPLEGIYQDLLDPKFDPRSTVWLEDAPGFEPHAGRVRGKVSLTDLTTDKVEVTAEADRPCVLVMGDNYSAGWKVRAFADSSRKDYRVIPANGFERGVVLSPGRHHFTLEYRPEAFVVGEWVSLLAWVLFIPFFLVSLAFRPGSRSVIMKPRKKEKTRWKR